MNSVIIDGVRIDLTPEQVDKIEKGNRKHDANRRTFSSVLRAYGFKKIEGGYSKDGVWAEIQDHGAWHSVWMVGNGVKNSHLFPGGWVYHSPKDLNKELARAFKGLEQSG